MGEHLIINEDDFDYFNRLVNSAVRDGFEIVSSNSHWDYERGKTIYHALATNKNPKIKDDQFDFEDVALEQVIEKTPIQQKKRTELSAVEYLLKFAMKDDLTSFCTVAGDDEIKPEWDEDYNPKESLGRVWNNGMGLLAIAAFTNDNILLVNKFLLNSEELRELTYKLEKKNVDYKVINCSPDDFRRGDGLVSYYDYLNRIEKIQKERNKVNFFQWLFK